MRVVIWRFCDLVIGGRFMPRANRIVMKRVIPLLILVCAGSTVVFSSRAAEQFRLRNGLRVILQPVKSAQKAAVLVMFDIGGNQDPKGSSGLAHLIEHVYCTAAAGARKARTVDEWMVAGGNAQTGEEFTLIADTVVKTELAAMIQDAAARMGGLRIEPAILERERG